MKQFNEGKKKQFTDNIKHVLQQEGSLLTKLVQNESMEYETKFFDEVQQMVADDRSFANEAGNGADAARTNGYLIEEMNEAAIRNAVPTVKRRQLTAHVCRARTVIDRGDNLDVLLDPTSMRVKSAAWAIGRKYDERIIRALTATARTGVDGGGQAPFLSTAQVIHPGATFDVTDNNTKKILKLDDAANNFGARGRLTLQKLLDARTKLKKQLFNHQEKLYFVCTEEQINDLLNDENLVSSDYNNVKALVRGEVNDFAGFNFVVSEMLPVTVPYYRIDGNFDADVAALIAGGGQVIRDCFAFSESAMIFGKVKNAFMSNISELPLYDYASFIYVSDSVGAVRMNDRLVVCVKCLEKFNPDHTGIVLRKQLHSTAATAASDLFDGGDGAGTDKAVGPLSKPVLEATYA